MTDIHTLLQEEWSFLKGHTSNSISISTTAKEATIFSRLPRREYLHIAMSSFMINDADLLKQTLRFFDGKVQSIYIDIEQKQEINLYEIAKEVVCNSTLLTVKPNDITLESTDLLIRDYFKDDLYKKNIIVIGTGNLASKIAVRLAERQACVFIKGRTTSKEQELVNGLNLFLPKYTRPIQTLNILPSEENTSLVVSFLSGRFEEEDLLYSLINKETLMIDAGINNFSKDFIETVLRKDIHILRLDTRIALPYQFLLKDTYVQDFFTDIFGISLIQGVEVASGGFIGPEGTVIVNNIKNPNQIIGIADGSGGVKAYEQLNSRDKERISKIKQTIS